LSQQLTEREVAAKPYKSHLDYYAERLRWLDVLIMRLLKRRTLTRGDTSNDHLRGLIVTDEEVDELLRETAVAESDSELEHLEHTLSLWVSHIDARIKSSGAQFNNPLKRAALAMELSPFEEQVLFLCMAVEINRKYEKLYAFIQDDVTCKHASVDLCIQLLCNTEEEAWAARSSFYEQSNMSRYLFHIADQDDSAKRTLLSTVLKLDERIVHYLLDPNQAPLSLPDAIAIDSSPAALKPLLVGEQFQERLHHFIGCWQAENNQSAPAEKRQTFLYLSGQQGSGKKLQVLHACRRLKLVPVLVDIAKLPNDPALFGRTIRFAVREAVLLGAVLVLSHVDRLLEEEPQSVVLRNTMLEAVQPFNGLIVCMAARSGKSLAAEVGCTFTEVDLAAPDMAERKMLWQVLSNQAGLEASADYSQLANKFRLSPGQIENALESAIKLSRWTDSKDNQSITSSHLHKACHMQVQHNLSKKAKRIEARYRWDDIVLPAEQKDQLRNACNQMKFRHVVFGDWGFDRKLSYGKGISMMFAGPPGTGKTMSAEVIATDLQLELYKIDLSQVISKYIGETEKNLHEIFLEAQYSNAILFFDEADAIFGKRSEVKDSHDKYANIETAYLLQKMEEYEGISILATNYSQNIDEAFMRRINYVVKFPFPDPEYREKIWRSMFPKEAPVHKDIDFAFIASKLQIAGGNIKNIVVSSAFLAAEAGEPIRMKHVISAAKHEMSKSGKLLLKEDFGDYY
jgi:hypothetical protein